MLTIENKACNFETREHIALVGRLMHGLVKEMLDRCDRHDLSKLERPEVEAFTVMTPALSQTDYGTAQNDANKALLGDALAHHYSKNRHHPEHFKNGVDDMNLIDIIEMFCDWKAAGTRHKSGGNIRKSIEINRDRFKLAPQLVRIMENTIDLVGE